MKRKVTITHSEYAIAYANWCDFYDLNRGNSLVEFECWIGQPGVFTDYTPDLLEPYTLDESAARRIKLLSSPNWRIILKANEARHAANSTC